MVFEEQLEADDALLLTDPVGLPEFARVKQAYLDWLRNMHRAVHMYLTFRRAVD